jgi:hypothetical protein
MRPVSAQDDPRDPLRPASDSPDISAAAERARERLHAEMEQVRVAINEMLADQDGAEESAFRNTFMERARGLSLAMLGIVTAIGLANPANLAINQGNPLFGGGGSAPSTSAQRPSQEGALVAQAAPAAPARAFTGVVPASAAPGGTFIAGQPGLGPQPVLIVGDLVPVGHGGKKPSGNGGPGPKPGPGPDQGATVPSPAPIPETIPAIETETSGGRNHGSKGDGSGEGPVSSGNSGGGPGNGHGRGHAYGRERGGPHGGGGSGSSHGHGPPASPGNSAGHGNGHGPPATAPPSTSPPTESAPPPPVTPTPHGPPSSGDTGSDEGQRNGHGNGPGNGKGPDGNGPPGQVGK